MQQMTTQPISIISINPTLLPPIPQTYNLKPKPHFPNPTIFSKWGKKRSVSSQRTRKLIINSIAHFASTLKILPEPFDSILREFCVTGGGNGGKFGFGFGRSGGDDGRYNRRQKFGFWLVLLVSSSLALWVVLEGERGETSEVGFWVLLVLASAFTVYFMVKKGWRREVKDWVLGFSCGAALMGLGLRKNVNFVRWIDAFRSRNLGFLFIKKKKRGRRWV